MRKIIPILFLAFATAICFVASAQAISVAPQQVLQGETVRVTIDEVAKSADVVKATFNGKIVPVFLYQGSVVAIVGIDLNQKPGSYDFVATLKNGKTLTQAVTVVERQRPQEELGVPQKLGGNTPQAQTAVVNTLSLENTVLAKLSTGYKAFWTIPFQYPLKDASITDPYGFERQTGQYVISHKGTDFHADIGTPVHAMNRGVVRLARTFKIYGKTIVVDHGLGIMTFYMHLSKFKVNQGQLVLPGQVIGLSGETGYAEAPHLHLSVRVGNISVDPVQFMQLLGK